MTIETVNANYLVTEGVSGVWHYHLSETGPGKFTRSLCGSPTMKTAIGLVDFGKPFGDHFPKKPTWCTKCAEAANLNKENEMKPTNWKEVPRGTPVLFRQSKDSDYAKGTWHGGPRL